MGPFDSPCRRHGSEFGIGSTESPLGHAFGGGGRVYQSEDGEVRRVDGTSWTIRHPLNRWPYDRRVRQGSEVDDHRESKAAKSRRQSL
jgi:hypothetical protein